jgi:hypothetical protein
MNAERIPIPDPRHITNGRQIPTRSYCDQPYIVQTDDGAWLCCVTTGSGEEGQPGQSVITMRSENQGHTWSEPVQVEPFDGPEASYAVMLKVPGGRIYIFYNHNTDNVRQIPAEPCEWLADGVCQRVDSLGYYVYKYSDDHGKSWSEKRHPIPVREMEIDRRNPFGGAIRYFWNVGKPFIHEDCAFLSLHKVGGIGDGFFTSSEGVLIKSTNLLTESDPRNIAWETLPDGEFGLCVPPGGGTVSEEHSYVVLSDGSFFSVYRTIDGHPACAYSRDGGHTWSAPEYLRYANGSLVKHPRAANFAWKCRNGKFLYWFHNHGGRFIAEHPRRRVIAYEDRNPAWLCGGVEVDAPDGKYIAWSQPEIVLYDDDPYIRLSYPDLVEEDGCYYLTETQKNIARVHEIDPSLVEGLWGQFDAVEKPIQGWLLSQPGDGSSMPGSVQIPHLPKFNQRDARRADMGKQDLRQGFSLDLVLTLDTLKEGHILLDNRTEDGRGFCLYLSGRETVEILLNDGCSASYWDNDPGVIQPGRCHHLVVTVDGGPKIITFIVDGVLCDGGSSRQFGWGRFSHDLQSANGETELRISHHIHSLRIYPRPLRTSEAVHNFDAMQAIPRHE